MQIRPLAIAAEDDLRRKAIKARFNAALQEVQTQFEAGQHIEPGPKLGGAFAAAPRLVAAE